MSLEGDARLINAGAASNPVLRRAAEESVAKRRSAGGVGDSHLAQGHDVESVLDRHHAVGHGARAVLLAHRRALREVLRRLVERHLVDAQVGVGEAGKLVHRRPAGDEVLHHLRRHLRRIGGDAARGDAVVAGEDRDARALHGGFGPPLPGGQPDRDLLQPAERTGGLGELGLPLLGQRGRLQVGTRHLGQEFQDFLEGDGCLLLAHRRVSGFHAGRGR